MINLSTRALFPAKIDYYVELEIIRKYDKIYATREIEPVRSLLQRDIEAQLKVETSFPPARRPRPVAIPQRLPGRLIEDEKRRAWQRNEGKAPRDRLERGERGRARQP